MLLLLPKMKVWTQAIMGVAFVCKGIDHVGGI